jgi:hypothetical protein
VDVINNRVCFSIGNNNLLSTSNKRKPFVSFKSISETITLSKHFSNPSPGNSYVQYHWLPIILRLLSMILKSSIAYNNENEGTAINNKTTHGNKVQKISNVVLC